MSTEVLSGYSGCLKDCANWSSVYDSQEKTYWSRRIRKEQEKARSRVNIHHFPNRILTMASPLGRLLILLVLAALIGVGLGLFLPKTSRQIGRVTGEYTASGPAATALSKLVVDDRPSTYGYHREVFGYRKTKTFGDDCDIREHILARDLSKPIRKPGGCKIQSGTLHDPYTDKTIHFIRGQRTSSAVQIDHVVALENAWQSGARKWRRDKLYDYGNDAYNLIAVDGSANQQKGSASAAYWLPFNRPFRCSYVARQIGVKSQYGLTVTSQERQAMSAVLHNCPAQQLPSH